MALLRRFRWSDLDGVLAVRNAEVGLVASQLPTTREGLEAYWRRALLRPERDLWLVERAGEVVAYGSLGPWHSAEWLQVEIVVHPEWRGRGFGQALLRRLVSRARALGVSYLGAVADDVQEETVDFLRRRGFEAFLPREHMRLRPIVAPQARPVAAYRLRPGVVEESAALARLTNAAYGDGEPVGQADAAGYRRYLAESRARVLVVEEAAGGQLCGLCEVYGRDVAIEGAIVQSGHIASLAVDPAHRRRGLGRWLLAGGIELCQETGWPSAELNVDRDNAAARRLYESVGFRPVYGFTVYRLAVRRRR